MWHRHEGEASDSTLWKDLYGSTVFQLWHVHALSCGAEISRSSLETQAQKLARVMAAADEQAPGLQDMSFTCVSYACSHIRHVYIYIIYIYPCLRYTLI